MEFSDSLLRKVEWLKRGHGEKEPCPPRRGIYTGQLDDYS